MSDLRYTNEEIEGMINTPKPVPVGFFEDRVSMKTRNRSRRGNFVVEDVIGRKFEGFLRQAVLNPKDFSVGLIVPSPAKGSNNFQLRRYCGNALPHSNYGETQWFDFHIHTATEEFQRRKGRDEDHFAEKTDLFDCFEEALKVMCSQLCILEGAGGSQRSLFGSFIETWKEN